MAGQTQKCNYCDIVLCRGETCDRCRLTRRPCAKTMAHHQSKIVGGDLDRVTFLHIGDTPQPRPAQGADLENVGKAASTFSPRSLNAVRATVLFSRVRLL